MNESENIKMYIGDMRAHKVGHTRVILLHIVMAIIAFRHKLPAWAIAPCLVVERSERKNATQNNSKCTYWWWHHSG